VLRIPRWEDHSLRRFNPSLQTPQHGIVDNYHINVRTFPILDALAHICVSQEKTQVVAVALLLDPQNKRIRLALAENKEIESSLVDHLTSLWGKLQNLSDKYASIITKKTSYSNKGCAPFVNRAIPYP
jgi:hypothetical protein